MNPKTEFLENNKEDVRWLADLVVSSRFQRCMTYALAQFVDQNVGPGGEAEYHRICGAVQFRRLLESFAAPTTRPTRVVGENLDHKV